jgi:hypothetical protein
MVGAAVVVGAPLLSAVALGLGVAGLGVVAEYFGGDTPLLYVLRYKVSTQQVHINKKPQDCDYYYAPVGYKGCQYKPVVKAYDKAGWLVGGDGAPIYSHDAKTGKPIESDDEGKTWEFIDEDDIPDPKVTSVTVSWVKAVD